MMWLVRVFASSFVRKLAYLLCGILFAFLFGHKAHATGTCHGFEVTMGGVIFIGSSESDSCAAAIAGQNWSPSSASSTGPQNIHGTGNSETWTCGIHEVSPPSTGCIGSTCIVDFNQGAGDRNNLVSCPGSCSSAPGVYDIVPPGGTMAAAGSTACGSNNCSFTMGPQSTFRTYAVGVAYSSQSATTDGTACDFANSSALSKIKNVGSQLDTGAPVSDCHAQGSTTTCVIQNATGTYCGTYNGDYVCVGGVKTGTCVSYASGGAACTVTATVSAPGAPDNGTAGTAATPTAKIVAPDGTESDYYTATQVASSTKGVVTAGAGSTGAKNGTTGSGNTGGAGGDGTTQGCVPSAQTPCGDAFSGGADCSAPPTCSGDPVTCGIANQAWLLRCENPQESALAAAVGEGRSIPSSSAGDFSTAVHEAGAFSGGGGCPAPVTVTVMGHSLTLDWWSSICSFASSIALVIMVVAYVVAARIMFLGVAGGFN